MATLCWVESTHPFYLPQISITLRNISTKGHIAQRPSATTLASKICCGWTCLEREAKLLASLNHLNIAAIHGFEHPDGIHFLVLELVKSETLAELVAKGPMPVEEALESCRQIAEGVEAAHY